jgi:hypothetical protein
MSAGVLPRPPAESRQFPLLELKHLSGLQSAETLVMGERSLRSAIDERLHRLGRVHVLIAHEPARLVGADRENGEPERPVTLARAVEVFAVA